MRAKCCQSIFLGLKLVQNVTYHQKTKVAAVVAMHLHLLLCFPSVFA